MFERALVRQQQGNHGPEETESVLSRAPRSVAHKGLAMIGVISTTLLVGASVMPSGAKSPGAPRGHASGIVVAYGAIRHDPIQAQATTQVEEALSATSVGELEQVNGHSSASTGSPAQFRLKEERDRLVFGFIDQLVYLESVFGNATPGSPAQFRAREDADSLHQTIRSVARG